MTLSRTAWFLLLSMVPALSWADTARTIEHARVRVADVVTDAPDDVAAVDLGPAPPPGGSRVVARFEVEDRIRSAGFETAQLRIPQAVRLVGASRRIAPPELNELCSSELVKVLPAGVTVVKADAAREIVVTPGATVRQVKVPRPPRQKGPFRTTATLEFQSDGEIVARAAIAVTLDVSEKGAQADVGRGRRLTVFIQKKGIRVSTTGVAQADANVGDVVHVQVAPTGRVIKALLKSNEEAEVVDLP